MADDKDVTIKLKAVINKQKNKVLFAEIESDFANVLLGFMTLPLGRIVQLMRNHYGENTSIIGSLNTLYNSLANLDQSHFKSNDEKKILLDPGSANISPFCNMNLSLYGYVPTDYPRGKAVTRNFVEFSASFVVSDDLRIMHNVKRSFIESLDYVGVAMADLDGAQTRIVTLGLNEIMDLLKGLFISCYPLTDIILGAKRINSEPVKSESANSLHDLIVSEVTSDSKGMSMTLTFQKSTKKFLFAQADEDFLDLLLSMLTIPVGAVGRLFKYRSGLKNITNLHSSITDMDYEVFNYSDTRARLSGENNPFMYLSLLTYQDAEKSIFVDSTSREFIITDELSVTPYSVCSTLSLLNQMKVSPSDVQELVLHIGFGLYELGLSILQASLTSTRAMTDGLINYIQEKKLQRKLKRKHAGFKY